LESNLPALIGTCESVMAKLSGFLPAQRFRKLQTQS
jgi:hypothetical protein